MSTGLSIDEPTRARPKVAFRCGVLALALAASSAGAETVRVTAWDMEAQVGAGAASAARESAEMRIQESAAALRGTNADVILLRQVRDWEMCAQLVQALKPANYNVLVCSAFAAGASNAPNSRQVAILAKSKAYFCWSEPWRCEATNPSGFAFAAIRIGKRRVGFFSAELDDRMSPVPDRASGAVVRPVLSACLGQWEAEMDSLRNWATNRIEAVVVAGGVGVPLEGAFHDGSAAAGSRKARGFAADFLGAPLDHSATQFGPIAGPEGANQYFLARLAPNPETLPGVVLDCDPATCELDLNPTNAAAAPVLGGESRADNSNLPSGVVSRSPLPDTLSPRLENSQGVSRKTAPQFLSWLIGTLGVLAACGTAVWFFSRRRAALVPAGLVTRSPGAENSESRASTETVVLLARPGTGSGTDQSAGVAPLRPAIHVEASALTHTQSGHWQQRAWAAGQRTERANAAMRSGLFALWSQWLKEKLVRRLIKDRTELLRTQHEATLKALAVDERLAKIELQLQRQNQAYERRIEELTRELAVAKEGQRELIRAQINQVKAEMDAARTRVLAQSGGKEGT